MNTRAVSLLAVLCLGLVQAACAGTTRVARPDALAARFAQADAQRAKALAPDLHARAERARASAVHARDAAARAAHEAEARRLLATAIAEADRIERSRTGADSAARERKARAAHAQRERERRALAAQARRDTAAQLARGEASAVFAAKPPLAVRGRSRAELDRERARWAAFLRDRARLTLAAAIALGLSPERAAQAAQRLAQADRAATGTPSHAAAQRALAEAERALGEARAARAPQATCASLHETESLLEMARERGLAAATLARGVAIALDASTAQAERAQFEHVAALARAHPHGALRIEALAEPSAGAAAQRAARARAARVAERLGRLLDPARLELVAVQPEPAAPSGHRLVFSAYRAACN